MAGDRFIPFSAATDAASASPLASEVMREIGIDISKQKPHEVSSLFRETFQYVVVMGDEPRERYPLYPFARKLLKWTVPDPEIVSGEPNAKKQAFRQIRDQMKGRVQDLIQTMNQAEGHVVASLSTAA